MILSRNELALAQAPRGIILTGLIQLLDYE